MSDFSIIVPSNVQPELHQNTASEFRVTFDRSYDLSDGEWEVALMEITYVNSMYNLVNEYYQVEEAEKNVYVPKYMQNTVIHNNNDPASFSTPLDNDVELVWKKNLHRYRLRKKDGKKNDWSYSIPKNVAIQLGFWSSNSNTPGEDVIILREKETSVTAPFVPADKITVGTFTIDRKEKKNTDSTTSGKAWKHGLTAGYYPTLSALTDELNGTSKDPMTKITEIVGDKDYVEFKIPKVNTSTKALDHVKWTYEDNTQHLLVVVKNGYRLIMHNGLHEILGFASDKLEAGVHRAKYPCMLNRGVYNFFIYCSIIQPIAVGDVQAQLLRMVDVPMGKHWSSVTCRTMTNPIYIPLNTNSFNSIHFEIRDDTGELIRFTNAKTTVTLHFRRKM